MYSARFLKELEGKKPQSFYDDRFDIACEILNLDESDVAKLAHLSNPDREDLYDTAASMKLLGLTGIIKAVNFLRAVPEGKCLFDLIVEGQLMWVGTIIGGQVRNYRPPARREVMETAPPPAP